MHVVLLTVADPEIGLGHLYRCDALAQALTLEGASPTLAVSCRTGEEWLRAHAPESPYELAIWNDRVSVARNSIRDMDLVVVDSYVISNEVRKYLVGQPVLVAWFDDLGEEIPDRGIIINGGPGAQYISYPPTPERRYLLGLDYQVLRRPFWSRSTKRVRSSVEQIGVMIGGTDPLNSTERIVSLLLRFTSAQVVVIGRRPLGLEDGDRMTTMGFMTARGIRETFRHLDLLISAGGQSVAEAVSQLLPVLIVRTVDNQRLNVRGWTTRGCSLFIGDVREPGWQRSLRSRLLDVSSQSIRRGLCSACRRFEIHRSTRRLALSLISLRKSNG